MVAAVMVMAPGEGVEGEAAGRVLVGWRAERARGYALVFEKIHKIKGIVDII